MLQDWRKWLSTWWCNIMASQTPSSMTVEPFSSTFWSLLCYFLGIKRWLFTVFYFQMDGQTEWQNTTMKAYLCAFLNWEQNNWVWFLSMAEFAHNNSQNVSMGHTLFELNCGYHPCVFFEDKCNAYSRSSFIKKTGYGIEEVNECLLPKLFVRQNLQKQVYNKGVKPQSYASSEKIWLNSKYIKTKRNWKLQAKFFELF